MNFVIADITRWVYGRAAGKAKTNRSGSISLKKTAAFGAQNHQLTPEEMEAFLEKYRPPISKPECFPLLYLCGLAQLALLYSLFYYEKIHFLTDYWYIMFVAVPLGLALFGVSGLLNSKTIGVLVGMIGMVSLWFGGSQLLLVLFSAKSVVCLSCASALLQLPFFVSNLLKEKVPQPSFAFLTYLATVVGMIVAVRLLLYPVYPGAYTPVYVALFFVTVSSIPVKDQPWSSATMSEKSTFLLSVLVVATIGAFV